MAFHDSPDTRDTPHATHTARANSADTSWTRGQGGPLRAGLHAASRAHVPAVRTSCAPSPHSSVGDGPVRGGLIRFYPGEEALARQFAKQVGEGKVSMAMLQVHTARHDTTRHDTRHTYSDGVVWCVRRVVLVTPSGKTINGAKSERSPLAYFY